jgi:Zn-dependent protease with chaperone function
MMPLVATLGQYLYCGFITSRNRFLILFWPGVHCEFSVLLPVWLSFGLMGISYVVGILLLYKKRELSKVFFCGISTVVIADLLEALVNHYTGLKEMETINGINLSGKVNMVIFASWQNPLWEEVVFRGIPLIILYYVSKRISKKMYSYSKAIYIIVPSIMCVIYHMPNHGPARIVDTFIIAVVFSYLDLKYSFFASLILHYMYDSEIIINMGKMKGVPLNEVYWLNKNYHTLNTIFSLWILSFIALILLIAIWNICRLKMGKNKKCDIIM